MVTIETVAEIDEEDTSVLAAYDERLHEAARAAGLSVLPKTLVPGTL